MAGTVASGRYGLTPERAVSPSNCDAAGLAIHSSSRSTWVDEHVDRRDRVTSAVRKVILGPERRRLVAPVAPHLARSLRSKVRGAGQR
jgi:hypothetical protein